LSTVLGPQRQTGTPTRIARDWRQNRPTDGRHPFYAFSRPRIFAMYVIGYFLLALAKVMDYVLMFYMWIIIARAVLSWVNPDPYNPIVRFIYSVTDPVIYRIRSKVPVSFGGIDFSPVLVILLIYFVQIFVVNSLLRFSQSLLASAL
jgi:YggT family protein